MSQKTLRARVSVILNCVPANPLPPPPVAAESREERQKQPCVEGPSDERMSTQFLHAHHSKKPPVSFTKASLCPSDDAGDLVSFGDAEDEVDDDDAMSTAASGSVACYKQSPIFGRRSAGCKFSQSKHECFPGGPVGAEGINDAPQVVNGSPPSENEPPRASHRALQPLSHLVSRQSGNRILNYLDDCLVIAQMRDALENHKCQLLEHLKHLGLLQQRWAAATRPVTAKGSCHSTCHRYMRLPLDLPPPQAAATPPATAIRACHSTCHRYMHLALDLPPPQAAATPPATAIRTCHSTHHRQICINRSVYSGDGEAAHDIVDLKGGIKHKLR
ncbi:extracellular calcium-sensing receptor-like protein [Labeo rohita]|uniref:Extracellular calcium-sensing receptor-like protein n=1 Tax=Labeo rohita TaxID=84645 RepID=A0A498M985_LABRO|nr:extracellular calcium-sensing receptor-like protein [Labeo rohita]